MPNTAIQIEHLSKMYRLGVINNGVLFRDIQTWLALKRGKEDPHSKIGENKYNGDKDHFWALKDISLDIKQGDRLGIIGKNGAGKSTLLRILSRITTPTEGTVKIKGKVASLLEVGTGFHQELTGRENIYLNGAILGMKKRRIDEKMDSIIEFSEIERHIDTPVKRYSSGMYVRLAFAVAAHLDSDILIADEVLAVGDAEFQKKALGKMQDLSTGEGRTVLFVSHNMGSVNNLCDISILLQNGNIIASGKTFEVIDIYKKKSNNNGNSKIIRTKKDVPVYINSLFTCDKDGIEKTAFAFSDNINLRIGITIEKFNPVLKISLALLSRDKTRIFSDYKYLKDIYDKNCGEIVVDYIIKGSFIAPSDYSFLVAIDNSNATITHDYLFDICPINIFDDGTDYAAIEGIFHYGFFIVDDECEWRRLK
jgi:lipopolysaccharide transport system ATP-binding protein